MNLFTRWQSQQSGGFSLQPLTFAIRLEQPGPIGEPPVAGLERVVLAELVMEHRWLHRWGALIRLQRNREQTVQG